LPSDADLKWFAEYRDKVKDALTEEDIKNAVYIAGRDRATPSSYRIEDKISGKELVFMSTGEGDASVTWDSGIPEIISKHNKAYFVNVTHGELACHPQMAGGIREILASGVTNLFSNTRPSVRGDEKLLNHRNTAISTCLWPDLISPSWALEGELICTWNNLLLK
jgi:hypothetical protein